jgi:predicted acetylornithine/succinylornithine family transaminase
MKDWVKESMDYLIPFYSRTPLVIARGKNHWVYDINNRRYLDFTSGIGVTALGHANGRINKEIKKQLNRISHISNLFVIPGQAALARVISERAFPGKAFFCNSGAEANETALKIARIYGNKKREGKNKVLSLSGSFHGRTVATITLTGQDKYKKGFEPLLQGIEFVNFNDTADLEKKMDDSVCAIFLEAIQGEGGVNPLSREFVEKVRALSEKFGSLLIFDEVQTGIGRTGRYFGYQNFSIEPDMITMAKALGNGFPLGAVLAKKEVADEMPGGLHASTFGGNFLACAAGLAVMNTLTPEFLGRIISLSGYFSTSLENLRAKYPSIIKENRVFGLMIGIDLFSDWPVKEFIDELFKSGILALKAGENTLRLLPPFTIRRNEIDYFCEKLTVILDKISSSLPAGGYK